MTGAGATAPGRSVLVVGFRVTGKAVAAYLRLRREDVVIAEDDPTEERRLDAEALGATFLGRPDEATLAEAVAQSRLVVPSPGIPPGHPVYRLAAAAGVAVRAELELGWERLDSRPSGSERPRLVAITGTNGKTTVTTLVARMLEASGLAAVAAGNIGLPLVEAAVSDADVLVTEVSSFQLQFTEGFHPAVSCWLNLAEDHLDWHPTVAHYAAAKARIWASQGAGDVAVLNGCDPAVLAAADDADHGLDRAVTRVIFAAQAECAAGEADFFVDQRSMLVGRLANFSGAGPTFSGAGASNGSAGLAVEDSDGSAGLADLMPVCALPRRLPLDVANALAAAATALAAGASVAGCRAALRAFAGLPHRVQLVAKHDGVAWYDDSKATTPASVLAALAGFSSAVLIAGGRNKGLDLKVLGQAAPPVRAVVAIGEAAGEVAAAFDGRAPVVRAGSMAEAVAQAGQAARPGDAVLLSPGCASFDWYRSYAERGDDFAALVASRIGGNGRKGVSL